MVGFGLARVADDEVGAEGGVGTTATDVGDAAKVPGTVTPAAHAAQERPRDVLEGQVAEVGHTGVEDHVDQPVGEIGRVEVEQPGAGHPGADGPDERHDRLRPEVGAILAEGGEILRHQHDLERTRGCRPPRGWSRRSGSAGARGSSGWRRSRRPGRSPRPHT